MDTRPCPYAKLILVCTNEREPGRAACGLRGSAALLERLKACVKENGLSRQVRVTRSGCLDLCEVGPVVAVTPDQRCYTGVTPADLDRIIAAELTPPAGHGPDARGEPA
ncbi:MAG: (2Fe-2S) ferredoxin domain-containing protein [Planctomycetes bacterium]|nr:(2Fe-2S) ferredoxin domain-containing protein [Planctomycetota bacterium]